MNLGENLKAAAIIGTSQKEPDISNVGGELGGVLGKLDRTDKEEFLLSAVAVFSIWKTAGRKLPTDPNAVPVVSEKDTNEILSGKLKQVFETLLQSVNRNLLLPEFLRLMAKHGKIIPFELLPEVLSVVNLPMKASRIDLRHLLLPLIGNRGKWLAKQRSEWHWALVEEEGTALWETGKLKERIFALEFFRLKDPAQAREIILKDWKGETAKEKEVFLEVLQINLGKADEEFLHEVYRSEKNIEVQRTAFELLAKLRSTTLIDEIKELICPIFSIKRKLLVKKELEINFPPDWNEKTSALNKVARNIFRNTTEFGEKGMALAVGLSLIEPEFWEEFFGLQADEILSLSIKSEWSFALLAGFGMASLRFDNESWFVEVLKSDSSVSRYSRPLNIWGERSVSLISENTLLPLIIANFNHQFCQWTLEYIPFETAESSEYLLLSNISPTRFISQGRRMIWRNLALLLPIQLFDKWINQLEKMKSQKFFNNNQIETFEDVIDILSYRKEYILEFEK